MVKEGQVTTGNRKAFVGGTLINGTGQDPLPEAVRIDFPEIELLTIVDSNLGSPVIAVEHGGTVSRYKESSREVAFVDSDYFKLFSYTWLAGNPEEVLIGPNSVVISEGLAQKYFGDEDPIGKTLRYNNSVDLHVTGVIAEAPQNTDFPFNMLIAYDYKLRGNDNWASPSEITTELGSISTSSGFPASQV